MNLQNQNILLKLYWAKYVKEEPYILLINWMYCRTWNNLYYKNYINPNIKELIEVELLQRTENQLPEWERGGVRPFNTNIPRGVYA